MLKFIAAATLFAASSFAASAATYVGTVFGTDSVYGTSVASSGATLAQEFDFAAGTGQVLSAIDIGGTVGCCGPSGTMNGPDGSTGGTSILGANGVSGITAPRRMFLAGVFVDSNALPTTGSGPTALNYSVGGLSIDDASFSGLALNQVFFIGDGLTGGFASQTWDVPDTADRLLLGFTDAFGFSGVPGFYGDNPGSFSVGVEITGGMPPVPLPAGLPLLLSGIAAFGLMKRRR